MQKNKFPDYLNTKTAYTNNVSESDGSQAYFHSD